MAISLVAEGCSRHTTDADVVTSEPSSLQQCMPSIRDANWRRQPAAGRQVLNPGGKDECVGIFHIFLLEPINILEIAFGYLVGQSLLSAFLRCA